MKLPCYPFVLERLVMPPDNLESKLKMKKFVKRKTFEGEKNHIQIQATLSEKISDVCFSTQNNIRKYSIKQFF